MAESTHVRVPAVCFAVLCFVFGIILLILECSKDCDRCSHHSSLTLRTPAYKVKAARILGVIQIICGIVSVAFGVWSVVLLGTWDDFETPAIAHVALPIWAGVAFYLISGTLGVLSGNKSNNLILANKWMSFCSFLLAIIQMVAYFLIAFSFSSKCYYYYNESDCSAEKTRFAVNMVLAVIGIVEFLTAGAASILAKIGVDTNKYLIEYDGPANQLEQRLPRGLTRVQVTGNRQAPVHVPNNIQTQIVIRQQGAGATPAPMPPPPNMANPVTEVELGPNVTIQSHPPPRSEGADLPSGIAGATVGVSLRSEGADLPSGIAGATLGVSPYSEGADLPSGIAGATVGVSPGNQSYVIGATTEETEPKPSFNYQKLF